MSDEQDMLKLKVEQAEAAVACAEKVYDDSEPGSIKDSCLQLLLAEQQVLEQLSAKHLLQQHAAAGVSDNRPDAFGIYRTLHCVISC